MTVNVSDDLLDEHRAFHKRRAERMDNPGEGRKLLEFHRRFMMKVRVEAIEDGREDPAYSWPRWDEIPNELMVEDLPPMPGWWTDIGQCEEDDMDDQGQSGQWVPAYPIDPGIQRDLTTWKDFDDDDEFGRALEERLHMRLHATAGWIYSDRNLRTMSCSPKSECFYAIHGMFTYWWNQYCLSQNPPPPFDRCFMWVDSITKIQDDIEAAKTDCGKLPKALVDAEISRLQTELNQVQRRLDLCREGVNFDSTTLYSVANLCQPGDCNTVSRVATKSRG